MTDQAHRDRIVSARMQLRERVHARIEATESSADDGPQGSGPPNRHGMPTLPPDQTPTVGDKWPVLDLGGTRDPTRERWHLRKGFWEERGYSNTAHPWRNDRYSVLMFAHWAQAPVASRRAP